MSTLPNFDLNLLPILLALHDARSVSMAAQQLGMSQPGVSTALGKLRAAFDDPLFVRTSRGMEPTPRALALIPAARDVLARVQQGILETGAFDPATTTHTFSISLSDVGEMVFLPRIVEAMARHAPRASVQSVSLPPAQIERALETGSLDLAVGYFPDLKKNLLAAALQRFYEVRSLSGLKKKPSTSELLDWLKLLMADHITAETLRERDPSKLIPPLHGALLKNEQDVHLFERLAFLARRERN
jgi:DNA-binding transcriptional LysR family regulator